MARGFGLLAVVCGLCLPVVARAADPKGDKPGPVRVTVVVVLATTENNVVDKKLSGLATEMEKLYPDLVGYKLYETLQKSIPVGKSFTFKLLEGQTLEVTVDKPKDDTGRIGLTVTPPGGDSVSYTCTCDKFFPLMTTYKTKGGSKLLLAIGAKPCTGLGP